MCDCDILWTIQLNSEVIGKLFRNIRNVSKSVLLKYIYKKLTICNQRSSNHFKILLILINDVDILIYRCWTCDKINKIKSFYLFKVSLIIGNVSNVNDF